MCRFALDSVSKTKPESPRLINTIDSVNWTSGPSCSKVDSAIHRIKIYPVYNAIGFRNTYPLDSDLSGG